MVRMGINPYPLEFFKREIAERVSMSRNGAVRIFVVGEEPVIVSTLAAMLNQSGFSVESFTNCSDALHSAMEASPDLLITDVALSHLSGIDLATQMKRQRPDCKILLFSGRASTAALLETYRAYGNDFNLLSKPIHPLDRLQGIRGLTRKARVDKMPAVEVRN
jgi:DNA-binding response OmpR family regulator